MLASSIYLDYAATSPLAQEPKEAMLPWLSNNDESTNYGNPSSLHKAGRITRQAIESARSEMAYTLGALAEELFFTNSGTESNNWVIQGLAHALKGKGKHLITTQFEHPSVLNPYKHLESQGWDISYLGIDADGKVSLSELKSAIRPDTILVSVIHGHNEIGTLQPIHEIGTFLKEKEILFHTDAVQTVGKIPIDLTKLPVDYLSFSGHKFYGPKGCGGLFIRKSAPRPTALLFGGGQESGLRSGTENVAGIIGMAKALSLASDTMQAESTRLQDLQAYFIDGLNNAFKDSPNQWHLNGPSDLSQRIPGNIHLSISCGNGAVIEGESLILQLDLKGICASSGSACHSAVIEPSPIILALGKSKEQAISTLRLSFGHSTTKEKLDRVIATLTSIIDRLAKSLSSSAS